MAHRLECSGRRRDRHTSILLTSWRFGRSVVLWIEVKKMNTSLEENSEKSSGEEEMNRSYRLE